MGRAVRRAAFAAGSALALLPVAVGSADPPFPSISPSGIVNPPGANGPSDHIAFSQDDRDMRLVAYDSAATNIVPGDTNGRRDVFVLRRVVGVASFTGVLVRASVGSHGQQANGDSQAPSLDGTTGEVPHCVAFESRATNLHPADRSPDLDVYVRDLRGHRTLLASPGLTEAHDASIDGFCRYVAFQAGVRVLVRDLARGRTLRVARGADPDIQTDGKGVTYERGGQIYYRRLSRTAAPVAAAGPELLVSDTRTSAPGNGQSSDPVVDDHGRHVAFVSAATDLCTQRCQFPPLTPWVKPQDRRWDPSLAPGEDSNGPITDIYRRTIGVSPNSPRAMVNASYDGGYGQANQPSLHPAISRTGNLIVFESAATNGIGGTVQWLDPGALPKVFGWYYSNRLAGQPLQRARLHTLAAWTAPPPWYGSGVAGSDINPSITSRGNYTGFTSDGTGWFGESNGPGISDVFAIYQRQTPP